MDGRAITQNDFSNHAFLCVGIISDTHGEINTLIQQRLSECDVILHAGDIGSSYVIKLLKNITRNVIPVCGNNDVPSKWVAREHAVLTTINAVAEVALPGGNIIVTHGDKFNPVSSRHKQLRQRFSTAKAIVYGHSHRLVCDQSETPWVLNPGAAGKVRTQDGASCLLVSASKNQWNVSEYRVNE